MATATSSTSFAAPSTSSATSELKTLLKISDGQLVYIAQQAKRLIEKEPDWDEFSDLKFRIEELESEIRALHQR